MNEFGAYAVSLYQVPIEHDKFRGYKHEETVTHYIKFHNADALAEHEDQPVLIRSDGGFDKLGWNAQMHPVDCIGANVRQVFYAGLVADEGCDSSLLD